MTSIPITPADREWLRKAAKIIKGEEVSKRVAQAAAMNLERLAYRADIKDSK